MTLYEAVECAASDLPPKWTIEICIEQGSASVYLYHLFVIVERPALDAVEYCLERVDHLCHRISRSTLG